MRRQYPPREYLRECLDYDPETGSFSWKHRPQEHFKTLGGYRKFNLSHAGEPALTSDDGQGYLHGKISFEGRGYKLKCHIVAWLIHSDDDLPEIIDHANRDRTDNRWVNLRAASHADNSRNRRSLNPHGKGIKPRPNGKFQAHITIDGRKKTLGTFTTLVEANVAYQQAAITHHGNFARF